MRYAEQHSRCSCGLARSKDLVSGTRSPGSPNCRGEGEGRPQGACKRDPVRSRNLEMTEVSWVIVKIHKDFIFICNRATCI